MALTYVILELLSFKPLTGYEIAKRFRGSLSYVWQAHHTQIYGALRRLEAAQLVTGTVEVQTSRPNRRVYAITDAGRAALVAWLRERPKFSSPKDEMLLKTFAMHLLAPEERRAHLDEHREVRRQRLADGRAAEERLRERYGEVQRTADLGLLCQYLVLAFTMRYEEMYSNWCTWALEQLAVAEKRAAARTGSHERRGGAAAPTVLIG